MFEIHPPKPLSSLAFSYLGVLFLFLVFASTCRIADASPPPQQANGSAAITIPPGTVLPVVLRTTISSETAKPYQTIRGQIAQDVPLPNGAKIRKGSKVEGQIVSVEPAANSTPMKISIRFDKLYWEGQVLNIKTDLRAIAGFMEVIEAGEPPIGAGEGEVVDWLPTTQIGGDSVFGVGGTVASAHDTGQVVGKSLMTGGVLVKVSPNDEGHCRGAIGDNDAPQALWVFSSDACGTYGLSKVTITHAGRTDPMGTATLQLEEPKTKIRNGAGMLLRVIS
jgi:hypothetical protein